MSDKVSQELDKADAQSDKVVLDVQHVKKAFRLPTEKASGMKQAFVNWTRGIKGYTLQEVLHDISFTVHQGDFFGIVGRNGSGKSTLLKLISGIYEPDGGKITVNGSIIPFIELGVGFNPELTGRENVYLNGAMLGFSNDEIDKMYDDIVDFAELHKFMDQKLKNYSSGMQVRLAFSVAIKAQGDILVLDEILAVGDEAFQRKCNDFFDAIKQDKSKTVILVTHSMASVQRYCNRAIYIKDGDIAESKDVYAVASRYSEDNLPQTSSTLSDDSQKAAIIRIIPRSPLTMSDPEDVFEFDVEYEIKDSSLHKEKNLYLAYNLHDDRRGGIIYDSGSINVNGVHSIHASIPMRNFHNTEFHINASLRKDPKTINDEYFDTEPVAYTTGDADLHFIYRRREDKFDYGLLKELG